MSDLFRLIYTSRDAAAAAGEEHRRQLDRVLAVSRRNNERDGITGALLFAAGTFAQILEGPRAAVEATFERIQCDARHADIDVLQCERVQSRSFADWDMAFVGEAEGRAPQDPSGRAPIDVSRFEPDELCAAVLGLVRAKDAEAAAPARGRAPPRPLDAGGLRAELEARLSADRTVPETSESAVELPARPVCDPQDAGDAVIRAALDEERGRTTELRRALDDARVALARAEADADAFARHRDIWADRSAQLRTALRETRAALSDTEAERGALLARAASHVAELDRLRFHRDIWAERARALASALCREPAETDRDGGDEPRQPARERFSLRSVVK